MDQTVEMAIAAVPLTATEQETWFEALRATTRQAVEADPTVSWDTLSAAVKDGMRAAGFTDQPIEILIQHLDGNPSTAPDTLNALAELPTSALVTAYLRLTPPPAAAEPEAVTFDPGAWNDFLASAGPRWNGAEEAWGAFRAWFSYEAGQRGLQSPADGFLDYVESVPDKINAFAQYRVTIARPATAATTNTITAATAATAAPDVSTFPELAEGSSGNWVDYVDNMLRSNGF